MLKCGAPKPELLLIKMNNSSGLGCVVPTREGVVVDTTIRAGGGRRRLALLAVPTLLVAVTAVLAVQPPAQATTTVSVFAGTGADGYNTPDSQTATNAQLWNPQGVATDAAGNVFIAVRNSHIVRKVSGGTISTFYGTPGTAKLVANGGLYQPSGVTVAQDGTVYIADTLNNVVWSVTASGATRFAGNSNGTGGYGGDGGSATASGTKLNQPSGVAYDDTIGTLYIVDQYNCRVRKVFNGYISNVAGNGTCGFAGDSGQATSAQLGSAARIGDI